ncbi:hypothetical protein, partial [Mesorhizobium sp. M1A.F.Ca.IN.022.07.1.1]|uniref:hypothetical protein n=1 Tax=Mesorhizobium sp. M1A.F.Ca.IN.022.07.1.1 TaxID=2496767 RepID=UPI0019D11263
SPQCICSLIAELEALIQSTRPAGPLSRFSATVDRDRICERSEHLGVNHQGVDHRPPVNP